MAVTRWHGDESMQAAAQALEPQFAEMMRNASPDEVRGMTKLAAFVYLHYGKAGYKNLIAIVFDQTGVKGEK